MYWFKQSSCHAQTARAMSSESDTPTQPSIPFRRWKIKLLFILPCLLMLLPSLGGTAFAYNRWDAVNYADTWALDPNWDNYQVFPNDCTSFASQALAAGGYQQVHYNNDVYDDNQWWEYADWRYHNSHSWSVSYDHYNFQMYHSPGGWLETVVSASDSAYWSHYDDNSMIGGDELFFDWGTGEGISHVAFQVWSGYDQYNSGWYGDLSDQHTTNRYHVSWNHISVNPDWPTTTIYEVHIDDGN